MFKILSILGKSILRANKIRGTYWRNGWRLVSERRK